MFLSQESRNTIATLIFPFLNRGNPSLVVVLKDPESSPHSPLCAMRSDYVIWSGYELDKQSFMDFVGMLYEKPIPPEHDVVDVVGHYCQWKDRLPPGECSRAPNIRWRTSDPEGKNITHIFLPMRWMPYKNRQQLNDPVHPDYATAHEPTEKDKTTLERWLNCVDKRIVGERQVKRDVFRFAVMKDLHPSREWRLF